MNRVLYLLAVTPLAACAPPQPAVVVEPVELAAPFDRTWNAVIDIFARQAIPIATIDKSSGLIASSTMTVNSLDGMNWADCGTNLMDIRHVTHGSFNVLVRGSGASSTIRSTARFTSAKSGDAMDCPSKGVWERSIHLQVKQAVEGTP